MELPKKSLCRLTQTTILPMRRCPDPLYQQPANGQGTRARDVPLPPITIRMIEPEVVAEPDVVVQEAPPLYLPAGSIISGTLITGLMHLLTSPQDANLFLHC